MQACELTMLVTSIACSLSKKYSSDELELLASIFSQLGDTLATIITYEEVCKKDVDE